MKIWGIVRNALGLATARYADGELRQPNLTEQGNVAVETILTSPGGLVPSTAETDDGSIVVGQTALLVINENYAYDNILLDWERTPILRGNIEGVALASAVRNGVQFNSADIIANNARGVMAFLNITANAGGPTINARFQFKDPASGVYVDAPRGAINGPFTTQTAAQAGNGIFPFQIGNVDGNFTSNIMARTFRIQVNHSAAGNFTYSVGYSIMY